MIIFGWIWQMQFGWKCMSYARVERCQMQNLTKSSTFQWLMHRNVSESCGCGCGRKSLESDPCFDGYPVVSCTICCPLDSFFAHLPKIPTNFFDFYRDHPSHVHLGPSTSMSLSNLPTNPLDSYPNASSSHGSMQILCTSLT